MKMKKNRLFSLIFICFFFSISSVSANRINNIDMDVYIDSLGNASVTEVWDVFLNEGTEGYRAYDLFGESEISNFSVTDEDGRLYDRLSKWNTNASFETKVYKSGILNTYDGIELCWGISSYGNRVYTLKYDISNFVTQYTDTQGIYFNLLDFDQEIKNVSIKIHSDVLFSLDNSRIWAFGNNGNISFNNGSIVMDSGKKLKTNEYMVLLVRFENNIFNTNNISSKSFDDIYNQAMEDISFIDKVEDEVKSNINSFTMFDFFVIIAIISFVLLIINFLSNKKKVTVNIPKRNYGNLYFGEGGKKLPNDENIPYYRDIPCNKDIYYAYWICYHYEVNLVISTLREGIIGAILLKWIRVGYVNIIKLEKKFMGFSNGKYALDLGDKIVTMNNIEYELYSMLKNASSDGKILKINEFGVWCNDNYSSVDNWFHNIITYTSDELEKRGLITNRVRTINNKYSNKKKVLDKVVSEKNRKEAIKMKGLRKFFVDFTNMSKKEYYDVHLWHEYLMFAQLLGVADKVSEQFDKLYPGFTDIQILNFIGSFAHNGYIGFNSAKSRSSYSKSNSFGKYSNNYSGVSRMSGSGGRSYSSGGRSSSRGSRGGGFR